MRSFLRIQSDTNEALKKAIQSGLIRLTGIVLGLGMSQYLARNLGAESLGILNLANRIVQICLVLCLFGFHKHLVRRASILRTGKDEGKIWKLVKQTRFISLTLASACLLIGFLGAEFMSSSIFKDPLAKWPFLFLLIGVVGQIESRIASACLLGYGKVWQSNLVDRSLSVIIICFSLFVCHLLQFKLTLILTATIFCASRFVVAACVNILRDRYLPRKLAFAESLTRASMVSLMRQTANLFTTEVLIILFSSISVYVLAWFHDMHTVALFTTGLQISALLSILLQLNNSALSSPIASLYSQGKGRRLRTLLQNSSFALTLGGLVLIGMVKLFAEDILLMWGEEFVSAQHALLILCIGQLVNLSTGATGITLIMAGYDKLSARISFFVCLVNLLLCLILIPQIIIGASVAVSFSVAIDNVSN